MNGGRGKHGRFIAGNPGGGRPKGSSSARAAVRRLGREIIPPGEMPLGFLLAKMRDEATDLPSRVQAAVACLPYCHARRRRDAKPFVMMTPTSAVEAAAMLATLPAMIASEEVDVDVANVIVSSLKSYLDAFVVTGLEAKVKALIDARKGNGLDEEPIDIAREELEGRIIDLKPGGDEPEGSMQ